MTDYPKVSVIVPVYNAAKTLRRCLKSVLDLDYPDFEVIVANDASTDSSASLVSSLRCKLVVLDKNSGPGIARNRGVESASGEILAFVDADCEAPRDWLKKIAENFKNHNIGAISGGYSESASRGTVALFQFYDTGFRQRNVPQYINSCITANFASRKKAFEEIGGFPAKRINEDMEFGLMLSRKHKILWDKDNGVLHHFNNSLAGYFTEQIKWSESAVESYFAVPTAIFKTNTWNSSEISVHLLLTALLYLSVLAVFRNLNFMVASIILMGIYLAVNVNFIKFIADKEGYTFALKIFPVILVRNAAWLLGITGACVKHLMRLLKRRFL